MLGSLIIGIGGIVTMMIVWIAIQSLWRKTFSDNISDEDVLADRTSCMNCGCTSICKQTGEILSNEVNYIK